MKNILFRIYGKTRFFSIILLLFTVFTNKAHTVNIYLHNKTPDTIFATTDTSSVVVKPGTREPIGSQEREPVHEEHENTQPSILKKEYSLHFFKLKKPVTINVTTSSMLLHTLPVVDSTIIGRDRLEWTVQYPPETEIPCLYSEKSSSYYLFDKQYQANPSHKKAYLISGEKKGVDLHGLPAADLHFTVEEAA